MILAWDFQSIASTPTGIFPVTSASPLFEDLFKKADTTGTRLNGTCSTVLPHFLMATAHLSSGLVGSLSRGKTLGTIQNFKVHYRKLLLRLVLLKIDKTNDTASQIVKLEAIRWVAKA